MTTVYLPLLATFMLVFSLLLPATAKTDAFSITILHSNDLHSHEDSYCQNGKTIGGMARIAHLIKEAKAKSNNVLAIDAGDIFQGTPYFEEYHGQSDVECLNKAGYDIFTIGNHEFDNGTENLVEALKLAKFEIVSANLDTTTEPNLAALVKPYTIKTIGGQKIAFIGMITPKLRDVAPKLQSVKIKAPDGDWLAPLKNEVEKLKSQGINKIIVVSHCGIELEKDLAEAVPEIDAVIGGHSHTRLEHPILVKRNDGSVCLLVQTGCYGRALGKLELAFDQAGKVDLPQTKYRLIDLDDKIPEDPAVKAFVQDKGKPFAAMHTCLAGFAAGKFSNQFRSYACDSPIGDLICDSLLFAGKEYGVQAAMQNRGGIRAWIDKGPITAEKIHEVLPFNNVMKVATVDGACLLNAMENSVSGILGARFLDVGGMKMAYDPAKAPGQRVVFILIQDGKGNWTKVKENGLYRIALNNFSFDGGEGYDFKNAREVICTDKKTSQIFQDYLNTVKKVSPALPNRLVSVRSGLIVADKEASSYLLSYPVPGTEFSIITGEEGVEFLPGFGTVPLKNPRIARYKLKLDPSGRYRIKAEELASSKNTPLWFAVALRVRDEDGGFKKLVTAPIRLP
ncbi:MAG: bifunctional metallophosphatase/5'-nucleotidase [Candidatus Obscuribacterales bacterium]|nr:bifunctional metallophosphatase/5'-nucleotidase [Candidatus Obscuribacterales bacterium]